MKVDLKNVALLTLLALGFAASQAWGGRSAGTCVVCEAEALVRSHEAAQGAAARPSETPPRLSGTEPPSEAPDRAE